MQKMLFSVPDQLASRFRSVIPSRQRSAVIARLLEKEVTQREDALYQCAVSVQAEDNANPLLQQEVRDWGMAIGDGLDNESW